MEVLREAPKASTFIPLAEHQSATPASFYTGPPVLHYYSDRSKVIILESELSNALALKTLVEEYSALSNNHSNGTNGEVTDSAGEKVVEEVDVWVTSDKLLIYSNAAGVGVSIPYPSISLHAIQSLPQPSAAEQQGLYMQLISSSDQLGEEDLEPESVSVTIIPTAAGAPVTTTAEDPVEDEPEQTPVVAMFTALSNCSNLHPDPANAEDEEDGEGSRLFQAGFALPGDASGGLPPPMPGSGGWITAENMHEFFDEEGNWIGGDDEGPDENDEEGSSLGPGAGTVRPRDGNQDEGEAEAEGDEAKWRRTS